MSAAARWLTRDERSRRNGAVESMAKQEQIYTIPVNDAFAQTERCPLCELEEVQTAILLEFYLGPSLMEADHRLQTNAKGFCREHLTAMYNSQKNRLGLGLMLHTHLKDIIPDAESILTKAVPEEKKGLFSRSKTDWKADLRDAAEKLRNRVDSCVICEKLEATMARYMDVIFWQYAEDEDFRLRFQTGQGFCLRHTADLLEGAALHLNQQMARNFVSDLKRLELRELESLCGDVEWFTLKFDYRNQNEPWKNSKDALPRAIRRLEGETKLS